VTPGPDMAVVTRNALVHGRRGVFLTTSGIALALVLWVAATAIGLSALLRGSSEILFALKVVGACYLAYLGARTLIDSRRRPAGPGARLAPDELGAEVVEGLAFGDTVRRILGVGGIDREDHDRHPTATRRDDREPDLGCGLGRAHQARGIDGSDTILVTEV